MWLSISKELFGKTYIRHCLPLAAKAQIDMPPYARPNVSSTSESENEEAPEAVSLSESKKETKLLEAGRRNAEASQRRAKKEKNKELDRKFKERAEMNRNRGKERESARGVFKRTRQSVSDTGEDGGTEVLGKRMARAVRAVREDEDDEKDNEEKNGDSDQEVMSITKVNPDYLPDELFAAAFRSSASADAKRKTKERDPLPTRPAKRRKSSKAEKDIVVGLAFFFFPSSRL